MAKDSWAASCLIGINNRIYGPSWCDLLKWHYDAVNERRQLASAREEAVGGPESRWGLDQVSHICRRNLLQAKKDQKDIKQQHKQNPRRTLNQTLDSIHSCPNIVP